MNRGNSIMTAVAGEAGSTSRRNPTLSRGASALSWLLQVAAAAILLQTLFFKFSASRESVYIFTTLGMEPWGRIATGVAELIACVLLLVPYTASIGAVMAIGIMCGAIVGHLTKLGLVVMDDGGLLFILAVSVLICSMVVLILRRGQLAGWIQAARAS